jgi:hypothetical protein
MTLGLTPLSDNYVILNQLRPQNNGWELIRIGAAGDGGYLIPDDLQGVHILSLSEKDLLNFRIIVKEIHFLEGLKNRWAFNLVYQPFFDKLLAYFDVVHLHPNNCCGTWRYAGLEFPRLIEVTLHRKDRAKAELSNSEVPHSLDSDCVPSNEPLTIDWPLISTKGLKL